MCVLPAAPMHRAAAVEYETNALETVCSTLAPGAMSHTNIRDVLWGASLSICIMYSCFPFAKLILSYMAQPAQHPL